MSEEFEEKILKEGEIGIKKEDIINSNWVQEIEDKIINKMGNEIHLDSLISFWNLCGLIRSYKDEAISLTKKKILKMIDGLMLKCPIQNDKECWCKPLEKLKKQIEGNKDECY